MQVDEAPGCAPHASQSTTCDYFLPPVLTDRESSAVAACEREAQLWANLRGGHRHETAAMCICNPVSFFSCLATHRTNTHTHKHCRFGHRLTRL